MRKLICVLFAFSLMVPVFGMKPLDEKNQMNADHHPTPFSAEEIKANCPPGRESVYLVKQEGRDPYLQYSQFTEETGEKAYFRGWVTTTEGETIGDPFETFAPWEALQAHGSLPVQTTTVSEAEVTVPAGTFTCWIYTIKDDESEKRLAFAQKLPGAPIKMEVIKDGNVIYSMVLKADTQISDAS